MSQVHSYRGLTLALIVYSVMAMLGCGKGKPHTDGKSDQPVLPGPGKGEDKPPVVVPSRPALPSGWQEFKHPEGAYSIFVPAKATRARQTGMLYPKKQLQPLEARESIFEVAAEKQPIMCTLHVTVFHPNDRAVFSSFEVRPWKVPNHWTDKSNTDVKWSGLKAVELIVEKSFPGYTPSKIYSVTRWCLASDRMYQFSMERTDRVPDEKERVAFFDSFQPGN